MNDMSYFSDLHSTDFHEQPLFYVEHPFGLKKLPEIQRQQQFINLMKALAPGVMVYANANAGKRSRATARKEGIRAGVFDLTVAWGQREIAFPEFKGFDARGRAGSLSQPQIDWGNAMHRLGFDVACFFDPFSALDWLRSKGCPIRAAQ